MLVSIREEELNKKVVGPNPKLRPVSNKKSILKSQAELKTSLLMKTRFLGDDHKERERELYGIAKVKHLLK